jgi:hypothetical protein
MKVACFGAGELNFVYRRKRDSPWKRRLRHRSGPVSIVDCIRRTWIHTITSTQSGLSEQQPSLWRAGMGYGDPIVTQLRPWDRFRPQVLQSSVQHKVANIWPDEDPIFWFLRGRAGDSCGCSGDEEVMVHLNSESTGSISDGRGHIEIERWFSTLQLVSYAA